jgi:hypothetical protein
MTSHNLLPARAPGATLPVRFVSLCPAGWGVHAVLAGRALG